MPTRRLSIVPYTYNREEIKLIRHTLTTLTLHFAEYTSNALEFGARYGLLKNETTCPRCTLPLLLRKKKSNREGYVWQCTKACGLSHSISLGSIFEGSHLSISVILRLIYMWSDEYSQEKMKKELKLNKNTCVSWCLKIREVIEDSIEAEDVVLGGFSESGEPLEVEIDESLFFKRKYNRGRLGNPKWVFGGIERNSGKCFFVPVEDRSAGTLLSIIYSKILPGTRIISDQWAAYRSLSQNENYSYASVNHSLNFVSPNDPSVHTQNIESLWSYTKRKLRAQFGTSEDMLESYFFEFVWRKRCLFRKENFFSSLILLIRESN